MDIKKENFIKEAKVELTEEYMKKIVREFITMSQDAIKYVPKDTTKFSIEKAFYQYTKSDPSNIGPDISKALYELNEKISLEAQNNRTLIPNYQNGYEMNPITSNQIGWYTYQSWHLVNQKKWKPSDISHRFYINANSKVIPELTEIIYHYYKEEDCPFYFKTSLNSPQGCKDNIVIYSSTAELDNTLEVLNKIEKEHPELIKSCKTPHLFTAPIHDWIGYATEPKNENNTYTSLMARIMSTAIEKGVMKWIHNHANQIITINGEDIKLTDYWNTNLYQKKNLVEQRLGYAEYISRLGILLNNIPKVDRSFKDSIFQSMKEELDKNHISPHNICMNLEVEAELKKDKELLSSDISSSLSKDSLYKALYPQYDFSFEGLKKTYDTYFLSRDENGQAIAVERNSNNIIADSLLINRLKFAMTWFDANSVTQKQPERDYSIGSIDYKYSFQNEKTKEIYHQLMDTAKNQLLTTGTIDFVKVNDSFAANDKHTHEIITNIASQQRYKKALETWVASSIQYTPNFSTQRVSFRQNELEEMVKDYRGINKTNSNTQNKK